ncbi:MAG: amidohydrolase family protein [Acidihalobacter sp.]
MQNLEVIDAHMHTWDFKKYRYPWLQEDSRPMWIGNYDTIKKTYLLQDYLHDTAECNVVGSIHMQAQMKGPAEQETQWVDACAKEAGYPVGIVGFCDLSSDDAEKTIERHVEFSSIAGIRQDLNWHHEPFYRFCHSPALMTDSKWLRNFKLLKKYNLSFDLQIYAAHQSEEAYQLVKDNEDTTFILNHSGAPYDRSSDGVILWLKGMRRFWLRDVRPQLDRGESRRAYWARG